MPIYEVATAVNLSLRFGIYSANRTPLNINLSVGDKINVEGTTIQRGDERYSLSPEDKAEVDSMVLAGILTEYSTGDLGVVRVRIANPKVTSAVALKAAAPTSASAQNFTASDLLAAGKAEILANPRSVGITGNGHAHITGGNVVITGTDINGTVISDTIVVTAALNTTIYSVKAFKTVTAIAIPAQGGTSGTFSFGYGYVFGVKEKFESNSVVITTEFPDGTVLTTPATADTTNNTVASNQTFDNTKDLTVVVGTPGAVVENP